MMTMGAPGCSGARWLDKEKTLPELTLTQEDQGRSIEMPIGQAIAIKLRENPGTGYRWAMEEQGADGILEPLAASYVPAPGPAVGAGGVRVWEFMAAKEGRVRLAFKHWRPWEGDASVVERFDAAITVHNTP